MCKYFYQFLSGCVLGLWCVNLLLLSPLLFMQI
nr:MAG TPA: hypothetical protein [Bacteriophage sp.]